MVIVGINAYHADSSAAIFVDGRLVAAIEEERFTRIKHWAGFPSHAIKFCLKEANISFNDVDHFVIGRDPKAKFFKKILYLLKQPAGSFNAIKDRITNHQKVSTLEKELSIISGLSANSFKSRIHNVEHHRSHIASAFFCIPFQRSCMPFHRWIW